jgi:hypothetical protein
MSIDEIEGWFAGRIPDGLYETAPEVTADREEILIVGRIPEPQLGDDTSRKRMEIASEAEHRFGRKVSWGVVCGEDRVVFTNLSMPVMTRLRMSERQVLDRLVEAGVAKSRSHALAWCVRLVGQHQQEWLDELKDALAKVEQVRAAGPAV